MAKQESSARARSQSRKLAMQALYQWLLTAHSPAELIAQYADDEFYADCDREYFRDLVQQIVAGAADLDAGLAGMLDRPLAQLDPVEHAVLLIGLHELKSRPEVPFKVVISEGVVLAKRFGATDGHKFVNAILDRAARELRTAEQAALAAERRR
jgi:N utilization substance protein B